MRIRMRAWQVMAAVLMAIVMASCAAAARGTQPARLDVAGPVKAGQWGGQHIAMTVSASETSIEFDCATASVTGAIETDANGAFTATGTFAQERPGPTTPDGPTKRPMRLSGTVNGDDMQLKVVLTDQNEDAGTFALSFGATPRLTRCK